MRQEAKRDQAQVEVQSKLLSLKKFSHQSAQPLVAPEEDADTLFILGSGASIETLTEKNFEEIGDQKSIGINYWSAHFFIPDIYSFESTPRVGDGGDFGRAVQLLNREEVLRRQPKLLILRTGVNPGSMGLESIPLSLRANTFLYGRISPSTRQTSNLEKDIRCFFSRIAPVFPSIALDSGASVVRMATIGMLLGFRKIVLVGVDLNGSRYFWEENPSHLEGLNGNQPVNNQRSGRHETMDKRNRPFAVTEMLGALQIFMQLHLGGNLYIASPSSLLADFLPQFSWKQG